MSKRQAEMVLHHIRRLAANAAIGPEHDRHLLERFARRREEAAFAALLDRYGAMVLRVCRRILHDAHEAEDAFQATFLILARKAGTIRQRQSLGSWLYRVAYHVAVRARADAVRREELSARAPRRPAADPLAEVSGRELMQVLDEELQHLPEKYRMPLLLCYLEGHTQDEAARQLGWSPQVLRGRIERGRGVLRRRLLRRGFGLSAVLAGGLLEQTPAPAAVPALLNAHTLRAAVSSSVEQAAVSAHVIALAESGINVLGAAKLKLIMSMVLMLGVVAAGLGAGLPLLRAPNPMTPSALSSDAPSAQAKDEPRRDRYGDPLPPGAVMRFGTVRLRHHEGRVLAFSADGKTVTSIGSDSAFRVWEVASGRLLRKLPGPHTFSWEGEVVCATHDSTLVTFQSKPQAFVFWDLATGARQRTLPWDGPWAVSLTLSPDGRTLAAAVEDNTIRLLDAESGKPRLSPLRRPRGRSVNVVFSPSGKIIAAGSENGAIDLWDAAGEHLRRVTTKDTKTSRHTKLAFSPDGKWAASLARGRRTVTLRTQATGTARHTLTLPPPDDLGGACLGFSHNGKLLAAGGEGRPVVVWDVASRKELHRLPAGFAMALIFSPNDRVLATSGNNSIRLWDLKTGQELHADDGHASDVDAVAVSTDGRIVASGSADDHTVRIWDRATGRQLHMLAGHKDSICAVALSPDGKTLFSGSWDGTIRQWDMASGEQRRVFTMNKGPTLEDQQSVYAFRLSADGRTLTAYTVGFMGEKGFLGVWEAATGKQRVKRPFVADPDWPVLFSPDGKTFIAPHDGKLVLEEVASGRRRELAASRPPPGPMWEFSSDGKLLAMAFDVSGSDSVAVYEVDKSEPPRILTTGTVGLVAFSPDRRYLATAGPKSLQLWELATGRAVLRLPNVDQFRGPHGKDFFTFVSSLVFTPDGRGIVTGMPDTTILLWSLAPSGTAAHPDEADAETLKRWWADLGGDDGPKGYAAVWSLATAPAAKTLAFLNERLRPAPEIDSKRVRKLMDDLDSEAFAVRQKAFQELEKLGEDVVPVLRSVLDRKPTLEVRKRLEDLLSRAKTLHAGDMLRGVRAVEVLERINSAEARQVLARLAKGVPEARLTHEAKAALDRLVRQSAP
jgi:RNA polymerase sigma factor (sigma-70 family)